MSAVLEADRLYRFFHAGDDETLALQGVSLTVDAGEIVAVTGPSGSGKSTLIGCPAIMAIITVVVQMTVGFLLALLFSKQFPLRRYLLILVLTPMMLSYVAVGAFFRYYYEPTFGLLSQFVRLFTGEPYILLATTQGAMAGIVFADAWMWSPFVMLLVLAGLVSVPKYLYEAAAIDRVSGWRRFWSITFPYIRGLLLLALLFRTIEAFKLFDIVFLLTEGGPGTSTETIAVYVYRVAFQYVKTSESTALAYILLFTVIVLTNLYLYLANRRAKQDVRKDLALAV